MEIADGLVQHNTIYYDGAIFARQIGCCPASGPAPTGHAAAFNAKSTLSQRVRDRWRRRFIRGLGSLPGRLAC